MPLQTTQAALNAKSPQAPGNVLNTAAKIRTEASMREWGPQTAGDVAEAIHGLQDQVNKLNRLIAQAPPPLQTFSVVDAFGSLIGWIGDQVTATAEYIGAWFKTLYIGGTGPADAAIVADANGNVTINGAAITLNSGGVTTVINNTAGPYGTQSLESIDNATGFNTAITPFNTSLVTSGGTFLAQLLATSNTGAGLLSLHNAGGGSKTILLTATTPALTISSGAGTSVLSAIGLDAIDINLTGSFLITGAGTIAIGSGSVSGTHLQNVGTGDSPTFANVTGGGTDLATLLADIGTINTTLTSLQSQITSLNAAKADHGTAITGTADLVTGVVTGTVS